MTWKEGGTRIKPTIPTKLTSKRQFQAIQV